MVTRFRTGFQAGGRSRLGPQGTYAKPAKTEPALLVAQRSKLRAHATRGGYPLPTLEAFVAAGRVASEYEAFLAHEQSPAPEVEDVSVTPTEDLRDGPIVEEEKLPAKFKPGRRAR